MTRISAKSKLLTWIREQDGQDWLAPMERLPILREYRIAELRPTLQRQLLPLKEQSVV